MKVKIDSFGWLEIDVKTESRGCSAVNQNVKDPNTEVYYGGLHACVTLNDFRIRVTMNPDPGDWKDAEWARARAWEVVCGHLTPDVLRMIMTASRAQGHQEGVEEARKNIRKALGV